MKRVMLVLVLLLGMPAMLQAATLTFQWDPMPAGQNWSKVRLYEKSGTVYTLLAEVAVPATQVVATIVPGAHAFVVRSYDGTWESADSNTVTTGPVPAAPSNLRQLAAILASLGGLGLLVWLIRKYRS